MIWTSFITRFCADYVKAYWIVKNSLLIFSKKVFFVVTHINTGMLFYKNASLSLCIFQKWPLWIKKTSTQNFFLWHNFLICHGPLGPHGPAREMGIWSIFSNIVVWPPVGKIISSRFRKTLGKSTKRLQRSTKSTGLYIICAWQAILSFAQSFLWSVHFWGMWFSSNYIYWHLFETLYSSYIKYTHKQKDTENGAFHIVCNLNTDSCST